MVVIHARRPAPVSHEAAREAHARQSQLPVRKETKHFGVQDDGEEKAQKWCRQRGLTYLELAIISTGKQQVGMMCVECGDPYFRVCAPEIVSTPLHQTGHSATERQQNES